MGDQSNVYVSKKILVNKLSTRGGKVDKNGKVADLLVLDAPK